VIPTYCQICGLPLNFDHYVPQEDGTLYIWRDDDAWCEPAIAFGAQHAWLRLAVGLSFVDGPSAEPPLHGVVRNGFLEPHDDQLEGQYAMEGAFDLAVVHRACWVLSGRPDSFRPLEHLQLPADQEPYRGQLFDFAAFVAHGHGWMLIDPNGYWPHAARNRERIIALLSAPT
jgi:hypothetical protein